MTKDTFKILMRHVVCRLLVGKANVKELTDIDPEIDAIEAVRFLTKFDAYVRANSDLVSPYIFLIKDSEDLMHDVTRRLWLRLMTTQDKIEILKLFESFFEDRQLTQEQSHV